LGERKGIQPTKPVPFISKHSPQEQVEEKPTGRLIQVHLENGQ